jgi:hypothetical protein
MRAKPQNYRRRRTEDGGRSHRRRRTEDGVSEDEGQTTDTRRHKQTGIFMVPDYPKYLKYIEIAMKNIVYWKYGQRRKEELS